MVAVKSGQIDAFLAKPNPAQPVILVYGPDAGLVHERAESLIRTSVDDINDPFALARLEGDDLAGGSPRLVEEANTVPLLGGRRAVWVRAGSRNFAPAVEALLAAPAADCRVVIEAGDLRRNAPLRVVCERAKNAATLPCYVDDERSLARLIDQEMRDGGLTIAPDARAALLPLLGGDRQASRSELRKLALYARGKEKVELDDVMAVIADASALALDGVVDAAFAGRTGDVETQLGKVRVAGTSPGSVLAAALRHVATLHKARLSVERGDTPAQVVDTLLPAGQFRRKPTVETALKAWTSARLEQTMAQLADAAFTARRDATLAEAIAQRAMLSIAVAARRQAR